MRQRVVIVLGLSFLLLLISSCGDVSGLFAGISDNLPSLTLSWTAKAVDLNGDGKIEILECYDVTQSSGPDQGWVNVYAQNSSGGGSFVTPLKYPALAADPAKLAVGDLNQDGLPDVVTVNAQIGTNVATNISVFMQDASNPGHLLAAFNLDTGTAPRYAAIGDANHDGLNDIVVAGQIDVVLFLQNASAPGTSTRSSLGMGFAESVAIADINNDGYNDLVLTNAVVVSVSLQNPNAPGTFQPARTFSAGLRPETVSVADLNKDGRMDLVVLTMGDPNDGTTARVSILLQDPILAGAFLPAVQYKASRGLNAVAVTDLNGDGFPDLAVANGDGNVSVLMQDSSGRGTFLTAVQYPTGNFASVEDISVADVNGDGDTDLVFTAGSGVKIRYQTSSLPGTFGPVVEIAR